MEKASEDLTTLDNSYGRNIIAIELSSNVPTYNRTVSITHLNTVLTGGPGQSRLCIDAREERGGTGQVTCLAFFVTVKAPQSILRHPTPLPHDPQYQDL